MLKNFIQSIETVVEWVGKAVAWLTLLLVLIMCFDVIRRYLFRTTSVAFIELEWYLFSMIFLLAASYTLKHDKHVRVDVFYASLSDYKKAWVNMLGALFFLFPFCLVVIYASSKYVLVSYGYQEGSPDPGGLPARYLIKAVIPIGFVLLLMQGIASFLNNLYTIYSHYQHKNS
ncbi:MAG: TRAP transporter small permease subunit [Cytophagales bacterium]|nr:MAG: TRAP transporter small permease subunit [Cytophagales bacterium]